MSFEQYFRTLYATFGCPLSSHTDMPPNLLDAAARRLRVQIPVALREYYLVAGREHCFNVCHNRLLAPTEWTINKQRLIFMEENQAVVYWGVSIRNPDTVDPPVSQGINEEPIRWFPEHRKCSVFLAVMLHYQAVSGGYRFCGSADAPDESNYRFEEHGWTNYGTVNSMHAYSRPDQVICLMPPGDGRFMPNWTVLAGARTADGLQAIGEDLGLRLE
jgi:hypothetical protein